METIGYMLRARSKKFHDSYTEPYIDFDVTLFPTYDSAINIIHKLEKICSDVDWCLVSCVDERNHVYHKMA